MSLSPKSATKPRLPRCYWPPRYDAWPAVVAGSVIGLMAANVPVAYCGELVAKIPARAVRITACAVFCVLGVLTLLGGGLTL